MNKQRAQKTINKNNKKKKKKKKRKKKVVFREAWASHMMGAWASHDNLSEKELQVVAVTNKNIAAEKEWEGKVNEAQASDTYENVENELLLLLFILALTNQRSTKQTMSPEFHKQVKMKYEFGDRLIKNKCNHNLIKCSILLLANAVCLTQLYK